MHALGAARCWMCGAIIAWCVLVEETAPYATMLFATYVTRKRVKQLYGQSGRKLTCCQTGHRRTACHPGQAVVAQPMFGFLVAKAEGERRWILLSARVCNPTSYSLPLTPLDSFSANMRK